MSEQEKERIEGWLNEFNVKHRVLLSDPETDFISDSDLNEIYNACDVGLNTSMGEGWGLINMEHAATRRAQVVPGHSACLEIWKDISDCIDIEKRYVPSFSMLELAEISVSSAVEKLERLYKDKEYYKKRSDGAYKHVTQERYQWQNIASKWGALFNNWTREER